MGNASLLCERSDLWNEIICNLEDNARERIGTRLKLRCKKHNQVTEVQWPVDFATIPEGGCTRECGEMLACGHRVYRKYETKLDRQTANILIYLSSAIYCAMLMITKRHAANNLVNAYSRNVNILVRDDALKAVVLA